MDTKILVNFDTQGGSDLQSIFLVHGQAYGVLPIPHRANYIVYSKT
ncbi:MAG: hypothetical protein FWE03_06845 [Firmicutes bacterium]|nr:hypothetical protein [Bacillota bacterium]